MIFLFISYIFFYLLELVLFDQLDSFDESDNDGSGSGFSGKSIFSADKYIGSVSGVVFGDFVPAGIKSLGDVVPLVVFVPR